MGKGREMKKYRPSNGAEGEHFMAQYCEVCQKDDLENDIICPIIGRTMAYDVDDPQYPSEWVRDGDEVKCTAFQEREENGKM